MSEELAIPQSLKGLIPGDFRTSRGTREQWEALITSVEISLTTTGEEEVRRPIRELLGVATKARGPMLNPLNKEGRPWVEVEFTPPTAEAIVLAVVADIRRAHKDALDLSTFILTCDPKVSDAFLEAAKKVATVAQAALEATKEESGEAAITALVRALETALKNPLGLGKEVQRQIFELMSREQLEELISKVTSGEAQKSQKPAS